MTIAVNPIALLADTAGIPILTNAIGRTFITQGDVRTQAEADAALRRQVRNFALFNLLAAAGLGYATARAPLDANWRSAALGGAVGTGTLGVLLLGALLVGPEPEARVPVAAFPQGIVPPRAAATWVSNLVGYPR